MRRLFEGGVYFKMISHWEEEERGRLVVQAKFSALTAQLRIAKILKRELDGRAAKYGHFELRNAVIQENKFTRMV